jgi:hypothetical protein
VHPINNLCFDNVRLFRFTAFRLLMFWIQNVVGVSCPKIVNGFRPSEIVYDLSIVILSTKLGWFFLRLVNH